MKQLLICMAVALFIFALWPNPDTTFLGNVICLGISGLCMLMAFIGDGEKRGRT